MILGYLWLVAFSTFPYNHVMASMSAFASALAFMAPVLLINSPAKSRFALTPEALNKLLSFVLVAAVTVIAAGAIYNFRFVSFADMYTFRDELKFPRALDSDVPRQAPNARLIALLLPFWLEGLGDRSCRGEGGT
jgi:hypothetical protein